MPSKGTTLETVRAIALYLPDVEERTSVHGTGFKVCGRLMACEAIHKSADPRTLMVRIGMERRAELIEEDPQTYYVTDHYVKYASILVRLDRISKAALKNLLLSSWEFERQKAK